MMYNSYLPSLPKVSEIGLGAWQLGIASGWKGLTDAEAAALVKRFLELGINFYDTATNYGHGTGEERPMAQQAIAFCAAHPAVTTVIPGSLNIAQLEQNISSVDEPMDRAVFDKLVQFYTTKVEPFGLPW